MMGAVKLIPTLPNDTWRGCIPTDEGCADRVDRYRLGGGEVLGGGSSMAPRPLQLTTVHPFSLEFLGLTCFILVPLACEGPCRGTVVTVVLCHTRSADSD
jgi:hypothetical protein